MIKKIVVLISTLLTMSVGIYSQSEKQLLPSEIKQLTVVNEPITLHSGFLRADLRYYNTCSERMFDENSKIEPMIGSFSAQHNNFIYTMQYGITDRFQIEISAPYHIMEDYSTSQNIYPDDNYNTTTSNYKLKASGLGDMSAGIGYQIFTETATSPSVVAYLDATFPTGRKNPSDIKSEFEYSLLPWEMENI